MEQEEIVDLCCAGAPRHGRVVRVLDLRDATIACLDVHPRRTDETMIAIRGHHAVVTEE